MHFVKNWKIRTGAMANLTRIPSRSWLLDETPPNSFPARTLKRAGKFSARSRRSPLYKIPITPDLHSSFPVPTTTIATSSPLPYKWAARAARLGFRATPTPMPMAARMRGPPLLPPLRARASTR